MTRNRLILIATLGVAAAASALGAQAQTCRVTAGITADGRRSYLEVYEYDYVEDKPQFPGGDSRLVASSTAPGATPPRHTAKGWRVA